MQRTMQRHMPGHMKAWGFDPLFWLILIAWVPTIFLVAMTVASGQIQGVLANTLTNQTAIANGAKVQQILYSYDYIIPFLTIGGCIVILWYAEFLHAKPFTFALGFIVLLLSTYVSFYMANAFHTIIFATVSMQQAAVHYPDLIFIVNYMPSIVALITVVYFLVAVVKFRQGTLFSESGGSTW